MSDRILVRPESVHPIAAFRFSLIVAVVSGSLIACGSSSGTNIAGGGGGAVGGGANGGAATSSGGSTSTAGTSAGGAANGGTSSGTGGAPSTGGAATGGSGTGGAAADPNLIGWASVSGDGVATTTGGGSLTPTDVGTELLMQTDLAGTNAKVVRLTASVTGSVKIGSNKTLIGAPGVTFTGHLELDGSVNVIIQNLKIVGFNCTDSPTDCSAGADAVTIINNAHHIWVDHCDVSDGSDGNLDITQGSDFVTVSWTKFSYSGNRSGGHQFSDLVGASDTSTVDTGKLNVTWHHVWWADHVNQRMPRVRFGKNHVFNSLYTATGNSYCVGAGVSSNILTENNVFSNVKTPVDSTSYSNAATIVVSHGNSYVNGTSGSHADKGTAVFTPPYPYTLDAVGTVQAAVQSGAGPQ